MAAETGLLSAPRLQPVAALSKAPGEPSGIPPCLPAATDTNFMLQFFRNFFNSRLGVAITLAIVGVIGLAFALADVSGSRSFGGVSGGDRVAMVGKARISTSELAQAAKSAFDNAREKNPQLTMKLFVAEGGLSQTLDQLIDRTAIAEYGRIHGIVAGDRLIDSEIAKIDGFRGTDGKFSETVYRQVLQQRGLSEAAVRGDISAGLIARQVLVPTAFGAVMPTELALRYAALLKERRSGAVALLPSAAFAPAAAPGDGEIAAYYAQHRIEYTRPERRVIRYAVFDGTALKAVAAPTEAEIAARYAANKANYTALEKRKLTQLILPTEAAARAVLAEIAGGKSIEAAAATKGLAAAPIGPLSRDELAAQSSSTVADAVFTAARGRVSGPAKGPLGWHVFRVDSVDQRAARTLDQARGEIVAALSAEKRRAALTDYLAGIEDKFDQGGNMTDAAKDLGVTPLLTDPLTADGKVYGAPTKPAPADLARVVSAAFAMERTNHPQLAEIEPGKKFVIFDVTDITPSAPAPLAEIKTDVTTDIQLQKGAALSRAAADKAVAAVRKGTDLGAAIAALGRPLPQVDRVDMGREQLTAMRQQVPPPIALLFSMAQGTVKLLPAPNNRGWYVVALKAIVPGTVSPADPLIGQAAKELGQITGREYAEAFRRAIRAEVGVTRNEAAIRAVGTQLTGGGN